MSRTDQIRQVIEHQRGRGAITIEQFIRVRGRNNTETEIQEAIEFCGEIIEAVPVVIDRVRAVAAERGLTNWVEPLVAHAEDYFLNDEDYMPEKQLGFFGLIDDAYIALRIINLIENERDPLLQFNLGGPIDFIRQVLGDEATTQLDDEVQKAQQRMHERMRKLQEATRRQAELERRQQAERQRPASPPSAPARPAPSPGRQQCGMCSGSGRVTCSSCYGRGSHTQSSSRIDWEGNVEYVTEEIPCGCAGGYSICGTCGGSGSR